MSSEIRLGIIGCGRILNAHLGGFKVLQEHGFTNFQVAALCARKEEDLQRFRKRDEGPGPRPAPVPYPGDPLNAPHMYVSELHPDCEPELYTDYREMLAKGSVDAVCIYTGHDNHHTIAIEAMQAGKHVAIEKPMAISVKAAKRMCEVAAETDRVLGIDENAYYSPATQASAWAVRNGAIGEVVMFYQSAIGGRTHRPDLVAARTPWRNSKLGGGGGPSIDLGVHFFNRIRTVCGPVAEVSAVWKTLEPSLVLMDGENEKVLGTFENEVDDVFFANFLLANGAIGHLTSARTCRGIALAFPGGMNVWGRSGALSGDKLHADDGTETAVSDYFEQNAPQDVQDSISPDGITDAFALEQLDFLTAISEGRQMKVAGEEGLIDLALSYAILESAELRGAVALADVLSGAIEEYQKPINQHYGL